MDELGIINVWIVIELEHIDWAGSESDFGLSIGGKLKLVKSATIKLTNPVREIADPSLRVFDIQFFPDDTNQYESLISWSLFHYTGLSLAQMLDRLCMGFGLAN